MLDTGDASGVYVSSDAPARAEDEAIGRSAQRKAAVRLLPVLAVGYGLSYMDRINISFASLQMNRDLHFSASVYGFGAGLFFIGYALCEVPSNLMLLRCGAKRWLARIMFTWGLLAAAMLFVRTPLEFNVLRFLLGVAEAGFFPGVIYYLTLWFPARMRARAVSRFYIALPLSSVAMGSLAGWLLGLGGKLGLSGWQWLFLFEGLPAAVFSLVILKMLPDNPANAAWLTAEEKSWLAGQLKADGEKAHLGHSAGVAQALLEPKVWMIGAFFFFALTTSYAYGFSQPAILQGATGWSVRNVGFLVACFGLAGAAGMLLNGAHSDRRGERALHCVVPCLVMAAGYLTASYAKAPWLVVAALAASFISFMSMQGPALAVPTQFLAGRAAASGIAAMNTITMFSGFVGPYWMGVMKDYTGNYEAGLRGLVLPCLLAAGTMVALTRSLARRPVVAPASLAEESA
ncbi:MAG: MFS transporter [Terracidiphilus sp.]|jgi:ACS family tartrate transporter-like MFS transporter